MVLFSIELISILVKPIICCTNTCYASSEQIEHG